MILTTSPVSVGATGLLEVVFSIQQANKCKHQCSKYMDDRVGISWSHGMSCCIAQILTYYFFFFFFFFFFFVKVGLLYFSKIDIFYVMLTYYIISYVYLENYKSATNADVKNTEHSSGS